MKKFVFLIAVAVVAVLFTCVQLVVSQDTAKGSFSGRLLYYNNVFQNCSGTTVNGAYYVVQFSTNGGSTWIDGPTTDNNGYFNYTPTVPGSFTMYIKAKNMGCPPGPVACGSASFPYKYGNPNNANLGNIYSVGCGGQK